MQLSANNSLQETINRASSVHVLIGLLFCFLLHILSALTGTKYFSNCFMCKDAGMGKTWAPPSGSESYKHTQTNTQERINKVGVIQDPCPKLAWKQGTVRNKVYVYFDRYESAF